MIGLWPRGRWFDSKGEYQMIKAQYQCLYNMCKHKWEGPTGPTVCPKCGHNYVWWGNYYTWKWKTFDISYNIKTGEYVNGDKLV